ncbi:hypothetical protein [Ectobacillus ponti]|uniref:Uncharacterized protein n=1 Tax=Ectobacillus ponti TaxID=2961894 RepID=A0AA41XAS8_9BACI|nr:hypothetical protein [Ectobacillus ponti]MCP8969510.1 hypothetical protein [Ectobacillus ponti]
MNPYMMQQQMYPQQFSDPYMPQTMDDQRFFYGGFGRPWGWGYGRPFFGGPFFGGPFFGGFGIGFPFFF